MDKGEMRAGAARAAIDLGGVLPFDGFDELRHEVFARALGTVKILSQIDRGGLGPALL